MYIKFWAQNQIFQPILPNIACNRWEITIKLASQIKIIQKPRWASQNTESIAISCLVTYLSTIKINGASTQRVLDRNCQFWTNTQKDVQVVPNINTKEI